MPLCADPFLEHAGRGASRRWTIELADLTEAFSDEQALLAVQMSNVETAAPDLVRELSDVDCG
jgi:hypothetical protein